MQWVLIGWSKVVMALQADVCFVITAQRKIGMYALIVQYLLEDAAADLPAVESATLQRLLVRCWW
jgi:hypothetical protein